MSKLLHLASTLELQTAQVPLQTEVTPQPLVLIANYYLPPSFAQLHLPQLQRRYLVLVFQVEVVVGGQHHNNPNILLGG